MKHVKITLSVRPEDLKVWRDMAEADQRSLSVWVSRALNATAVATQKMAPVVQDMAAVVRGMPPCVRPTPSAVDFGTSAVVQPPAFAIQKMTPGVQPTPSVVDSGTSAVVQDTAADVPRMTRPSAEESNRVREILFNHAKKSF